MTTCVTIGNATLYCGDCKELTIEADCLLTDAPYGAKNNCDYTRFSGGLSPSRNYHEGIVGDDKPFDPKPWLAYSKVVLFGYQFFAQHLPLGTILVWNKKRPNQLGTFLSDCELAWMKGGKGCYLFNHVWHGFDRESEKGKSKHPSAKPQLLMGWILDKLKLEPGATVYDPYMGSCPIGEACLNRGLKYVGCEIVPSYFDIAVERLEKVNATLQ